MTTPPDPLAQALRAALDDEPKPTGDDALIARAIGRALASTAAVAKKAETAGDSPSAALPPAAALAPSVAEASPAAASAPRPLATVVTRDALDARRRSRALRYLLPLAAAFAATAAMAMVVGYGRTTPEPTRSPKEEPPPPVVAAVSAPALVVPTSPAEPKGLSVDDLPTAAPVAPHASVPVGSIASAKTPAEVPKTAAELFREANAERRGGDVGKAVEAYRVLLAQHPEAAESQASRVTLGRLLLDKQGKAALALVEFDAYLARGGDPALAEEARLGRATCLERLGRRAEERKAWEELLARHPNTLHAAHARARIDALDGDRPAAP